MKRVILAAVGAAALVVMGLVPPASAHTASASGDCEQVTVSVSDAPPLAHITLTIAIDGTTVAEGTQQGSWSLSESPVPQDGYAWTATVHSNSEKHPFHEELAGAVEPCEEPPVEECPEGQVGTPPNCEPPEEPPTEEPPVEEPRTEEPRTEEPPEVRGKQQTANPAAPEPQQVPTAPQVPTAVDAGI